MVILQNLFMKLKSLFGREVYYVNGADTLPPPLTRIEEEEVFAQLAENDTAGNMVSPVTLLQHAIVPSRQADLRISQDRIQLMSALCSMEIDLVLGFFVVKVDRDRVRVPAISVDSKRGAAIVSKQFLCCLEWDLVLFSSDFSEHLYILQKLMVFINHKAGLFVQLQQKILQKTVPFLGDPFCRFCVHRSSQKQKLVIKMLH